MNFKPFLLALPLFLACHKSKTEPAKGELMEMDLNEIMQSDDYFKIKKKGHKTADSLERHVIRFSDLNNDGVSDSAIVTYNETNSRYRIRFSCYSKDIFLDDVAELELKDVQDLNGDGFHEVLVLLQAEGSCWDEINLYSWNSLGNGI